MSHVTQMDESCHTYECVMLDICVFSGINPSLLTDTRSPHTRIYISCHPPLYFFTSLPSLHLSSCPSVCPFICLSVCLSISRSLARSIALSLVSALTDVLVYVFMRTSFACPLRAQAPTTALYVHLFGLSPSFRTSSYSSRHLAERSPRQFSIMAVLYVVMFNARPCPRYASSCFVAASPGFSSNPGFSLSYVRTCLCQCEGTQCSAN